ncbi:arabinan endo-1,5-alpha-L-arabinosidase [Aspergillus lucknowensis]|uniref:Arabinan endo-1,5-alpha-L-arabinosidase n=1 Tax=Aspergillus lucknowensis TaxID=176173 RepID=A0ABR4LGC8_9EURO
MAVLLALCLLVFWALSARARPAYSDGTFRWGAPSDSPSPSSSTFAPTRQTDLRIHDPSIIHTAGSYYSYSVGPHITVHSAPALAGPWRKLGTVLTADSVIPKGDRKAPWAPATVQVGDRFYCYYAVSNAGCRDSAIGVASSSTSPGPGPGTWTDHGLLIQSGNGEGADAYPLDQSNTIDPSVFVDDVPGGDGSAYLNFGSFWTGIWQVRLSGDMLSVQGGGEDARHLAAEPTAVFPARKNADRICGDRTGGHPVEGSFLSFHGGWYYLWFSWGRCCEFREERLRKNGKEYRIRVGRSKSPRGPFVDKQGKDLVDGGGETVYGSNGELFAPGGQGVLTDELGDTLYYHYLNTSISYDFWEARLGYNRLEYVDGWPVAQ